MKQLQTYTRRLIEGEGALGDQVEDKRRQYALAEKLEQEDGNAAQVEADEIIEEIEYEDEDRLMEELENDQPLN